MPECPDCTTTYESQSAADRCCMEPPRWDNDSWH